MSLLSKIFGKKSESSFKGPQQFLDKTLGELLKKSSLDLTAKFTDLENGISIDLTGADEELLIEKDGMLLDAIQLFLKRCLQHSFSDQELEVVVDSNGFRSESSKSLMDLVDKLRQRALDQGRSVYLRALPPKDRKIVHQYLANDDLVKSRSVGDGLYKKIKIFPVKRGNQNSVEDELSS